jgi:hypothetical protein
MRGMNGHRVNYSGTAVTVGHSYWATEFERIYLMTAARIRGESTSAVCGTDTIRAGFVHGR